MQVFLHFCFIFTIFDRITTFKIDNKFREKLNSVERKSFCCRKNLDCCTNNNKKQDHSKPPSIEIRAILTRCPGQGFDENVINNNMKKPMSFHHKHEATKFQGFDEDEPSVEGEVVNCNKKLIITMKITNEGPTNMKNEFVVVDHVYDPVTERRTRLLSPYVIKIKQDLITQMYGLKFQHVVNSEAKEIVYNKHDGNYTGCDISSKKPTCGAVKYRGNIVPYSTGFCCSCDAIKNAERQPFCPNQNSMPAISYSDPSFLLNGVECPNSEGKIDLPLETTQNMADIIIANPTEDIDQLYVPSQESVNMNKTFDMEKTKIEETGKTEEQEEEGDEEEENETEYEYENNDKKCTTKCNALFRNVANAKEPIPKRYNRFSSMFQNRFALKGTNKINSKNRPVVAKKIVEMQKQKHSYPREKIKKMFKKKVNEDKKTFVFDTNLRKENIYDDKMNAYVAAIRDFSGKKVSDDLLKKTNHAFMGKRQIISSGAQLRGGQDCADRYTPPKLNAESYHESTHCLRFSDVWYTVYQLEKPIIDHSLSIQIFEKHEDENGNTRWRDLTKGKVPKVGTFKSHYFDQVHTVSIKYRELSPDLDEINCALDYKNSKLLIPESVKHLNSCQYPEIAGGPGEYLVIRPNQVSLDGDQCNVAGVGFEAFYKQPNRCSVPKGSCLMNQPKHLWQHDDNARRKGLRGCFFLKHYGILPKNPIRNISNSNLYLAFQHDGKHSNILDIEVKADFNSILRPQSTVKITEVYIDSTSPSVTMFTIKVTNSGLTSSSFSVSLSDCPLDMPAILNSVKSKQALIPPQHQHIFNLQIKFVLPSDRFHCSIEAFNYKNELVALRRIRIQKFDRCICTWYCLCACVGSVDGLKCRPMSLEHYHAAGFQGALPITTLVEEYTFLDDMISLMFYILLFFCLVLLILGITKAVVGCCCCPHVGMWGLDVLLDLPKKINRYHEFEIRNRTVVYDENGWPIHPDTKKRVRSTSLATEFCMNVLFFYTYPLYIFTLLIQRLCCPYYTYVIAKECECKTPKSGVWDAARPKGRQIRPHKKSEFVDEEVLEKNVSNVFLEFEHSTTDSDEQVYRVNNKHN